MIDARRMEVFTAAYNADYGLISATASHVLTEESFKTLEGQIYFIGDCNTKAKTVLNQNNFIFMNELMYPSANEMSELSYFMFLKERWVDVAYFEPSYHKAFYLPKKQ
jgi:tRNA threonylcarbamoyladenosine biosynthesis protein TsaB